MTTVTLRDIAKQVGRSVTTVSRALADYDDVSEVTRLRVRQAAQELGYEPNTAARQLQKQRTDTLGLVIPTLGPRFSDPFFSEFLAGVGNEVARQGFDLLVSTQEPGDKEEQAYLKTIRSRRVDGFIVVRTRRNDPRINLLRSHRYPFAVFGRVEGNNDFPLVDEDSEFGIRSVVKHLIELRHTRIGCIAPPANLMLSHYRLRAFIQTLKAHSLSADSDLIITATDLTQGSGRQAGAKLLDLRVPPTAIVACNDLMAFGAMSAAQERGLRVGKDVSITGFDDIPSAEHAHPPLTTVRQPIYKIGTMVCEMLIKIIKGEQLAEPQIILQPSLIVRQSSGLVPS